MKMTTGEERIIERILRAEERAAKAEERAEQCESRKQEKQIKILSLKREPRVRC